LKTRKKKWGVSSSHVDLVYNKKKGGGGHKTLLSTTSSSIKGKLGTPLIILSITREKTMGTSSSLDDGVSGKNT
jgi:hypothetical protein